MECKECGLYASLCSYHRRKADYEYERLKAEAEKPVLVSTSKDGSIRVMIGPNIYEYWLDSATHRWIKVYMARDPWKTLDWIKKNCSEWRKL